MRINQRLISSGQKRDAAAAGPLRDRPLGRILRRRRGRPSAPLSLPALILVTGIGAL